MDQRRMKKTKKSYDDDSDKMKRKNKVNEQKRISAKNFLSVFPLLLFSFRNMYALTNIVNVETYTHEHTLTHTDTHKFRKMNNINKSYPWV